MPLSASNGSESGLHEVTAKLSTDELIRKLKVRHDFQLAGRAHQYSCQ